jgi:hypothetical protein
LRLNGAGRRYLIRDGSSISKGVDVLSAVSDEIDCVFLHLLENPSLCDRRAADTTTGRWRPASNLDGSSSTGEQERSISVQGYAMIAPSHSEEQEYPSSFTSTTVDPSPSWVKIMADEDSGEVNEEFFECATF